MLVPSYTVHGAAKERTQSRIPLAHVKWQAKQNTQGDIKGDNSAGGAGNEGGRLKTSETDLTEENVPPLSGGRLIANLHHNRKTGGAVGKRGGMCK